LCCPDAQVAWRRETVADDCIAELGRTMDRILGRERSPNAEAEASNGLEGGHCKHPGRRRGVQERGETMQEAPKNGKVVPTDTIRWD